MRKIVVHMQTFSLHGLTWTKIQHQVEKFANAVAATERAEIVSVATTQVNGSLLVTVTGRRRGDMEV